MDEKLKQAFNAAYSEAFQTNQHITTDALRYLLTLSVSLLTLLVPLLIFVIEKTQSRFLFFVVVVSLLLSSLACIAALIIHVRKSQQRENYARQLSDYAMGQDTFPEKQWESPHALLSTLATISGICFGIACVTLCLILFHILFS